MDQTEVQVRSQRRRGCVFYGCLSLVVIFVFGLLAIYIGAQFGLRKLAANYTSPSRLEIPRLVYSREEATSLEERIARFTNPNNSGAEAVPLELSAGDLNWLLQSKQPALEKVGGFSMQLATNGARALISIPLDNLGRSALKGRFLNGEAVINVELNQGVLHFEVKSFTVNGKPLPAILLAQFQSKEFLAAVNNDPKVQQLAATISRLEIKNGKVLLWPKATGK